MTRDLFEWDEEGLSAWVESRGEGPSVLLHSLRGFIDAGHAGRLLTVHILEECEPRRVATFHIDELLDYRSRRPEMTFSVNQWTDYDAPYLVVDLVTDGNGAPFLLLHGTEPDLGWERFAGAVRTIVERAGVTLTLGAHGIPMAVPHTRPLSATVHGTRPDLLPDSPSLFGTVTVPASASNLLEYRFGEWGLDAINVAVHVPHYLSQSTYPQATQRAMGDIEDISSLVLTPASLDEAAVRATEEIDRQAAESDDVQGLVRALEEQYDLLQEARQGVLPLDGVLPTAEEIGAEFEKFLESQGREFPGLQ